MHFSTAFPGLDATWVNASIDLLPNLEWRVDVSIDRPPADEPITSADIDVVLEDTDSRPLTCTHHPEQWVEAGGAASMTANATYLFSSGDARALVIQWQTNKVCFHFEA